MKFNIHTTNYEKLDKYSDILGAEVLGVCSAVIEINSIERLVEMLNKIGHDLIIERDFTVTGNGKFIPVSIEIYDDYRE